MVTAKVKAAERVGLNMVAGIFISNAVAVFVILAFPSLAYRIERDRRFAYSTLPKLVMFLIGFESVGLASPPMVETARYLLFLLYLLPHGTLEFSALSLAYCIAKQGAPLKRLRSILLALSMLLPAAYIEVNFSLSFALHALHTL